MRINPVEPVSNNTVVNKVSGTVVKPQSDEPTFTGVKINSEDNKHVQYLYNKVVDITKKDRIPAVFNTGVDGTITISPQFTSTLDKLKELGIKFTKTEK